MLDFLKDHPFPVQAFFESSVVLTFAVPKEELADKIPECLSLDTFNDQWAFIAVAMVQTKHLRPKGFPKFLGNNFFLMGYRLFVKYTNQAGKRLRGLYILKSETDKRKMEFFGNFFTHYNYSKKSFKHKIEGDKTTIFAEQSDFHVSYNDQKDLVELPENSPFNSWKEARRFAGPLPFTFTYEKARKKVLIIQGLRQNWKPEPLKVNSFKLPFIESLNLKNINLANCFVVKNIPYEWKKGVKETWNH